MDKQVAGVAISGGVLVCAVIALALFVLRDTQERRFSGDPAVDRIIEAVRRDDVPFLLERVAFQATPCHVNPTPDPITQVMPVRCPPGAPDGAPVDSFMAGAVCQATWLTSDQLLLPFGQWFGEPAQVFAVVKMPPPVSAQNPQYRIVFSRPGDPGLPESGHLGVQGGQVVQLSTWCGSVYEQLGALQAAGGEIVYQSPDLVLRAAVRADVG